MTRGRADAVSRRHGERAAAGTVGMRQPPNAPRERPKERAGWRPEGGHHGPRVRLQRFLREGGFGSRRHAEQVILAGRVRVNGQLVQRLGTTVERGKDRVEVDGKLIRTLPLRPRYLVFYKPDGVVSTRGDRLGRRTVFDLLPAEFGDFFLSGRLDYHTTGLMFLTNDGELAQLLAHPRYEVEKTYEVKVAGAPSQDKLDSIARGPVVEGEKCLPVVVRQIGRSPQGNAWLELKLREGKKNQIRIMFEQIGHPVKKLKRVSVGPFKLAELRPGECRELSARLVVKYKATLLRDFAAGSARRGYPR
ncbi:MAG: pseudouridine synthase [Acidobacteriota bacterium]